MRKLKINQMKKLRNLLPLITLLTLSSCLNRQFVEGRAELITTADSTLNDSSLVYGYIYRIDWENYNYSGNEFEVWQENSDIKTTNNTHGFYSLMTVPGTHTIKCQEVNNEWEKLIVEMKNLSLSKNKKTQIDFYIGYTIE
jgi:hypothetical protein